MIKLKIFFTILALLCITTGCGGYVQKAPPMADEIRKSFPTPRENMAGVYIYRKPGIRGSNVNTEIFVDGKILGKNLGNTYLYVELPEGQHKITTYFMGYVSLDVNLEAGRLYFVQDFLRPEMFDTKADLLLVDEETGKQDVLKCDLVSTAF